MPTTTKEFIQILLKNKFHKTFLPSLNLWIIYISIHLVLFSIFNEITVGIIFVFGLIFAFGQKEDVKESFKDWWYNIPNLRFHGICILLVIGVILATVKIMGIWTSNNLKEKYER